MYYYEIAVPIKLNINLTYHSETRLSQGIRVIVSVGRNLYTGIVIAESKFQPNIRYKSIIEVIDSEPIISINTLTLAKWMTDYYKTSLGIVIDTMLPLALKFEITQKIKLNNLTNLVNLTKTEVKIIDILKQSNDWITISNIRDKIKKNDLYHAIEHLENEQIIDVFRTFDEKIKPKFANYLKFHPTIFNSESDTLLSLNNPHQTIIHCTEANLQNLTIKLSDTEKKAIKTIQEKLSQIVTNEDCQSNKENGNNYHSPKQAEKFEIHNHQFAFLKSELPLSSIVPEISYATIKSLKSKKIVDVYAKKIDLDLFSFPETQHSKEITLNNEQLTAIKKITNNIENCQFQTFLLYGITGSGKTEVYIKAILATQKLNKSALMLVPEISLTPQTVQRFFHVFGKNIAVLHSHLNDRERYLQWKMIANGTIKIVIGARSAIFAPLKNIGVIIIDEEHESSYKQDYQPCYNARDLAVMRAKIEKATAILGSATPSLESWQNALKRKYSLVKLTERAGNAVLPEVKLIQLNDTKTWFSDQLKEKIADRLEKKEQIILFHNRRGYANFVQCVQCRKLFKCPDCDISLNYHKTENKIVCHYCGFNETIPRKCPDCGSYHFIYGAPGTEQIETQLCLLFPSAKVLRMDSDTTRKKHSFTDMFEAMRLHHIDIMLGTQMISKGLDFHNVTLVGIILAEVTLNIPDFRSVEKTFQLLTQVAGRSGRGDKNGEVIIQSLNPTHYALTCAAKQDFLSFSHQELITRAEAFYPPKFRMCRVLLACTDLELIKQKIIENQTILLKLKLQFPDDEFILLPFIEAPLPKIKNKYRFHCVIKSLKIFYIQKFLDDFIKEFKCPQQIQMTVDIDPMSLM